ncbi:MAG TPA: hypothetical protein VHN73_05415, partial [Phenylobacterium sp.]|nr:hypothetical protein [Phenylobacterium sp.]
MRWASTASISLASTLCAPTLLHAQISSTGVHIDAAAKSTITPVNGPIAAYRRDDGFFKFPPGRRMGSSSTVAGDSKGHIWVVDRCAAGQGACANSELNPVWEFDANGKVIKNFCAGLFLYPHGLWVDREGFVWVT